MAMPKTLITKAAHLLILRKQSQAFNNPTNATIKHLAKRKLTTLAHINRKVVVIATTQPEINRQLVLVQRFDKTEKPFKVIINPEIIAKTEALYTLVEGCLSIPAIREKVTRPCSETVKFPDTTGNTMSESVNGYTALIFQHEIGHLNGILFTDRLTIP
ncbi:MAG: peptide deformylase [Bacteroidales bacterium]|nr:peptide deformylase [Bacteroidales bacterium]